MAMRLGTVAAVVWAALMMTGCAQTSRLSDELTTATLTQHKKGVALMALGIGDPLCVAGIGIREKDAFRRVQTVRIVQTKDEPSVAEVELDPGEYHVVSYICRMVRNVVTLADPINGFTGLFRKSYASFRVEPGEVVNVGVLQLIPLRRTEGLFSRTLHVALAVTDWPLAELERFKQQRPKLYSQMKTRLMTVPKLEPPTPEQLQARCAEIKKLQAEGKVQNLPAGCTAPAGPPAKPGGIAKKEIPA